jgi:hypothetical protein
MKHKSTIVGEMIAFSVCNESFKPIGIPSCSEQDFINMIYDALI